MKPWRRIEPTTVHNSGYRTIVTKSFQTDDDSQIDFDTYYPEGQEFAGVIALTKDNQVVLARQFRPGPEKMMDELPGGFIDEGETPEQAARRELIEEAGYKAGRMEYLGYTCKDAYMNGRWHGFIAFDCERVSDELGVEKERIERKLVSIAELIKIAKNNGLTDVGYILMAYDKLKMLEKTTGKRG